MPRDSKVIADTAEWMERATEDLRSADALLSLAPPIVRGALFNLQQAAEKSLKGFLLWHGVAFRKTHSLIEIGQPCAEIDNALSSLIFEVLPLADFAAIGRYPGPIEIPDPGTVRGLFAAVRVLVDAVKKRTAGGGK